MSLSGGACTASVEPVLLDRTLYHSPEKNFYTIIYTETSYFGSF